MNRRGVRLARSADPTKRSDWSKYSTFATLSGPPYLDEISVRTVVGLSGNYSYASGGYGIGALTGPSTMTPPIAYARRRRYREVYQFTATQEIQGNAAATGQTAFLLTSYAVTSYNSGKKYTGLGQRIRCVASGNRVIDDSVDVDVIDSADPTPNWCSTVSSDNGVDWSEHVPIYAGDIIDKPLLDDLILYIDALRRTSAGMGFSGSQRNETYDSYVSFADLTSHIASARAAAAPGTLSSNVTRSYWDTKYYAGGTGEWIGAGTSGEAAARNTGTWTQAAVAALKKRVEFWPVVLAPAYGNTPQAGNLLDAQGTGITLNWNKLWHWTAADIGPTTAAAPTSITWDTIASAPPNAGADPSLAPGFFGQYRQVTGFALIAGASGFGGTGFALNVWNCTGGFAQTTVVDGPRPHNRTQQSPPTEAGFFAARFFL